MFILVFPFNPLTEFCVLIKICIQNANFQTRINKENIQETPLLRVI